MYAAECVSKLLFLGSVIKNVFQSQYIIHWMRVFFKLIKNIDHDQHRDTMHDQKKLFYKV